MSIDREPQHYEMDNQYDLVDIEIDLNVDSDDENEEEPWNCKAVTISKTELFTIRCIYGFEKSLNLEFDEVYEWTEVVEVIAKFVETIESYPSSTKSFEQVDRAWAKWIETKHEALELNTFAMRLPLDLINPKDGNLQFILAFQQFNDFEGEIIFVISEKIKVKSLKELAAAVIVDNLDVEEDIEKLDIPISLTEDLKNEFSDYCKDWMDGRAYVCEGQFSDYDSSSDFELDRSTDDSLTERLDSVLDFELDRSTDDSLTERLDSVLLETQHWRSVHHQI